MATISHNDYVPEQLWAPSASTSHWSHSSLLSSVSTDASGDLSYDGQQEECAQTPDACVWQAEDSRHPRAMSYTDSELPDKNADPYAASFSDPGSDSASYGEFDRVVIEEFFKDATLPSTLPVNSSPVNVSHAPPPARHHAAHRNIDPTEERHMCPVGNCGRSYRRKTDLKYHVQRSHQDYPIDPSVFVAPKSSKEGKNFTCPLEECPCGFKHRRDLERHMLKKHPELSNPELAQHKASRDFTQCQEDFEKSCFEWSSLIFVDNSPLNERR